MLKCKIFELHQKTKYQTQCRLVAYCKEINVIRLLYQHPLLLTKLLQHTTLSVLFLFASTFREKQNHRRGTERDPLPCRPVPASSDRVTGSVQESPLCLCAPQHLTLSTEALSLQRLMTRLKHTLEKPRGKGLVQSGNLSLRITEQIHHALRCFPDASHESS